MLRDLPLQALRAEFASARPFPHIVIDDLLQPEFAAQLADCLPDLATVERLGHRFDSVNEKRKTQLTDPAKMPREVAGLLEEFHSARWLAALREITGIQTLEIDPQLNGGGLHATGARGRLDVHADFNYLPTIERFRRLNLLVYLNRDWDPRWGGELELWNADMTRCERSVMPDLGRCVLFATDTKSFHGTTRVDCPEGRARYSLALYYYSYEPPPGFDDDFQGTVFKARPKERFKGRVLMPLETSLNWIKYQGRKLRQRFGR